MRTSMAHGMQNGVHSRGGVRAVCVCAPLVSTAGHAESGGGVVRQAGGVVKVQTSYD